MIFWPEFLSSFNLTLPWRSCCTPSFWSLLILFQYYEIYLSCSLLWWRMKYPLPYWFRGGQNEPSSTESLLNTEKQQNKNGYKKHPSHFPTPNPSVCFYQIYGDFIKYLWSVIYPRFSIGSLNYRVFVKKTEKAQSE